MALDGGEAVGVVIAILGSGLIFGLLVVVIFRGIKRLMPVPLESGTIPPPPSSSSTSRARWIVAGVLLALVVCVLLACHFRYTTVSGVGAHFYLVDRWTGNTWFVRGTVRVQVKDGVPSGYTGQ